MMSVQFIALNVLALECSAFMSISTVRDMLEAFCTKGGRLGPRVGDGHVFAPKEVSWISLLVTSRFLVENTTKLYPGPTIQSRPCRP